MMKRFLVLVVVLATGLGLFSLLRPGRTYANFPPVVGETWVAFGDSLTAGTGASEGNDFPTLLGARIGVPIINMGTPGATTQDALGKVEDVLRAKPRVVLLCFGGNDTLSGMPHARTFANLGTMIDQLHQSGAFVVLLGIRTASVRDKYRSEFNQLAKDKRVLLVPNILAGVLGDPGLMSDYVHPNDQGYAVIAGRIEKVLAPLLPHLVPAR